MDGLQTLNFGDDDTGEAVVFQPDGKALVAGSWDGGSGNFAVGRFNADGLPDLTFSGDAQADVTFDSVDVVRAMALAANVPIRGDEVVEAGETFLLNLSASSTALVGDSQATGTIANDDVAPRTTSPARLVGRLRMRPRAFRAARRGSSLARIQAKRGSVVSYRLSVAGTVRFKVSRRVIPRRCRSNHGSGRGCRVFKRLPGSWRHAGVAGGNRLRFTGRPARRTLAAGTYRLTAFAPNGGKKGTTFRIVR